MKKRRQGKILLQLNVLAAVICIIFAVYLFFGSDNKIAAGYFGVSAVGFLFNLWLVSNGNYRIAEIFCIILSNLLVYVFDTGFIDDKQNTAALYIPLILFTYVVTRNESRVERWALIIFTFLCLSVVNFTDLSPRLGATFYTEYTAIPIRSFNLLIAITSSLMIISTVSRHNYKAEEELIAAKELAEQALNEKTKFFSIMSHEIRTPANAVVGMTNILMGKSVSEEIGKDIRVLSYSAQNLKAVIDNIIYYNKLELGKEDIINKPFDIRKFCYSIVDSFALEASKKGIKLNFDFDDRVPQYLVGDSDKLGQIINNLLSNAIKFTSEGDIFLWVKMNHIDDRNCYLLFKLADTGIGIDREKMRGVFNEFSQMNSDITRTHDGMGLGLSITRKLLALLGSEIHVNSEEGVGTTFFFEMTFPLATDVKDDEQRFIETHDLRQAKILLVEDNALNVLVAKKILNNMNGDVDTAKNGEEGVRMALHNRYDVVLMDIHMPVMDGYEATRKIREKNKTIPIVAFTADAFEEARVRAREAGMTDFISKPFDPVLLYDKIVASMPRK